MDSGKSRKGTWGSMLGAKFKLTDGHEFKTGLHSNAALYLPSYFSSSYDFEKTLIANVDTTNLFFILNQDSDLFQCDDVNNDGLCNNNDIVFLSKEMQTLFLKDDYVHPTIGTSFGYEYNYYDKRGLKLSGMYLMDNDEKSSESYYIFDIELYSKYGYILKSLNDFSFYFHRNFSPTSSSVFKNNLLYGLKANFQVTNQIMLDVNIENVHYDINQDALVEDVTSIKSDIIYNISNSSDIIEFRNQRILDNKFILFSPKHNWAKNGVIHEWIKDINPFKKNK